MFASGQFPTPVADLSDSAGWETTKIAPYGHGDYMKGAFYFDDALQTMNFMAVWPQEVSPGKFQPFVRVTTMKDAEAKAPAGQKMSGLKAGPLPKANAPMKCETCGKTPVKP